MTKKGIEQSGAPMFGNQRGGDFLGQVIDIMRDAVGHLPVFGVAPAVIDHVECRRLCWQELHMDAPAIEVTETPRRCAVPPEAIPDHQQRAREVPVQLLHAGKDIVAREMVRSAGKIPAEAFAHWGYGDGPGDGEAIKPVPTRMDGGLPLRRPGTAPRGLVQKAGLLTEHEGTALTPGFFFAAAMSASARGPWRLHHVHGRVAPVFAGST